MLEFIGSSIILYLATVYISQNHQLQPHRFVIWIFITMFVLIVTALGVAAMFGEAADNFERLIRGVVIVSVPAFFLFFILKNQFYVQSVKERVLILGIYVISFTVLTFI